MDTNTIKVNEEKDILVTNEANPRVNALEECPWCKVHPHRDPCCSDCATARAAGSRAGLAPEDVADAREMYERFHLNCMSMNEARLTTSLHDALAAVDVLGLALERTLANFRNILAGRVVRDVSETIAEAEHAIALIANTQECATASALSTTDR